MQQNFSDWQLKNIDTFGIIFPRFQKLSLLSTEIQDEFNRAIKNCEEVNPLTDYDGVALGAEWYEWLADAPCIAPDHYSAEMAVLYAARHFSWEFPQLKMVVHSVEFTKADDESEFYTDGFRFVVEFY
jgi:hypothetical protein